jgi:hypothetical protein
MASRIRTKEDNHISRERLCELSNKAGDHPAVTLPSEFMNSFFQYLRRSGQNCLLDLRMFIRSSTMASQVVFVWGPSFLQPRQRTACDPDVARCAGHRNGVHTHPQRCTTSRTGTDNICFAVSALVFIPKDCNVSPLLECSIFLIFNLLDGQQFLLDSAGDSPQFCAKVNTFCDFNSGRILGV